MDLQVKKTVKGRALFTAKKIRQGEVILTCKAFSYAVSDCVLDKVCHGCLKNDFKPIPNDGKVESLCKCSQCNMVRYCSRKCQNEDWEYHRKECLAYKKGLQPGQAVRHVVRILRHRFRDLQMYEKSIKTLASNSDKIERRQLEKMMSGLLPIASVLGDRELIHNVDELKELLCRCAMNSNSILSQDGTILGVGLYPDFALINHDCFPNATVVFEGKKLIVRANQDIPVNEEITISYHQDAYLSVSERRNHLSRTFCFDCFCQYCTSNIDRDPSCAIVCPTCKETSFSFESISKPWTCKSCGYQQDYIFNFETIPKSIDSLLQMIQRLDEQLPETNFYIRKLRSLLLEKDYSSFPLQSPRFREGILQQLEKFFQGQTKVPESNLKLMMLYCDAAAIASDFSAFDLAIKWYKLSLENCAICYGSSSKIYKMIDARLIDLLLFIGSIK